MKCASGMMVLAGLLVLALPPDRAFAIKNADCLTCHEDVNMGKKLPDGATLSLYVDMEVFKQSVHGDGSCTDCHSIITELPHGENLPKVKCGDCHEESEAYAKSLHGLALEKGETDVASCDDCHGKHDIRGVSDPLSMVNRHNQPPTCGRCHSNPLLVKNHMISILNPSDSYLKSAHSKALESGNEKAPTCSSCHSAHDLAASNDPASPIYRPNIPATCGQCHPNELALYEKSIHGKALENGIRDAPTCVDCHGEHDIEGSSQEASKVTPRQVVTNTCTRCHDDERVMSRYGIVTKRQASYMDSYHGLASAAGSKVVASCSSCHNAHDILAPSNPESSTYKDNLPKTCGKCHQNASANFSVGSVHIMPTAPSQWILGLVRLAYILLICGVMGGMIVHNTLLMIRRSSVKFFEEWRGVDTYRRFPTSMTIGHLVLTISFIALAVSGFALRYPESWWAQLLFHGEAGLAMRGVIHRIAAIGLVAVALINGVFLVFTKSGRKEFWALMFSIRDLFDIFGNLAYIVGLRKAEPKFDRYSYIEEEFEYWGMWWGTLLMIVTGFSMWFVNTFLQFLPKIALDVVALIHFYEAWLAVLTIVVWHLYYMIFDPQTYPMNWSWITGRITMEDFKHRHPLEYEREVHSKEGSEKK